MRESAWRSFVKALTWRVLATADTILLAFFFTGSIRTAFSIGGLEVITKSVLYVLHERGWQWLKLGRKVNNSGTLEEAQSRSAAKAVTWRVVGALDTFVISFIITGHPIVSLSISGTELVTKIFLYYVHERIWTRVQLGLVPDGEEREAEDDTRLRTDPRFKAHIIFAFVFILVLVGVASAIGAAFK